MRTVGNGHKLPAHASVREDAGEYLIEPDVNDFTEAELAIEAAVREESRPRPARADARARKARKEE